METFKSFFQAFAFGLLVISVIPGMCAHLADRNLEVRQEVLE